MLDHAGDETAHCVIAETGCLCSDQHIDFRPQEANAAAADEEEGWS
ncbi:MAG: hypothetical protein ACK54C_13475 [Betaproteobacteria bacterium]